MRRGMALALGALLLLTSCGGQSGADSGAKTLYDHGLDVVSLMDEMASSEAYIALMLNSPETAELAASFAEGDHTRPKAVYQITLSGGAIFGLPEAAGVSGLSERLRDYLDTRMLGSVASMFNASAGVDTLAAVNICAAEKTFVSGERTEDMAYLYTFEDAAAVFVAFTAGEGGAASATGWFIADEAAILNAPEAYGLRVEELSLPG